MPSLIRLLCAVSAVGIAITVPAFAQPRVQFPTPGATGATTVPGGTAPSVPPVTPAPGAATVTPVQPPAGATIQPPTFDPFSTHPGGVLGAPSLATPVPPPPLTTPPAAVAPPPLSPGGVVVPAVPAVPYAAALGRTPCCVLFRIEGLLMAYHRADGMRVGTDSLEQVNSSFNLAPRLTLGYEGAQGTGVRARWFDYNHNERTVANVPGEFISVDTFNVDLELFDKVVLNPKWSIEVSGGYRINNFEEIMADFPDNQGAENEVRTNSFNGQGGVVGIEARRSMGWWGSLYGNLRGSILMGDHTRSNVDVVNGTGPVERLGDVVNAIWEIGVGYERTWTLANGSLAYIRLGGEWQQWENFSSAFGASPANPPATDEARWAGESDVGFGGVTFAVGYIR